MKPERRWLKSVIAASTAQDLPAMPWARSVRQKPASPAVFRRPVPAERPAAIAAR